MLKTESKQAVDTFFTTVDAELKRFIQASSAGDYEAAAQLIRESQAKGGRIHVTGIGKCSHVSTYAASLLSSTGNPAYYLHGTEAVHGSCGQLAAGDVVIAISNSGETGELKATVLAVKNNGCKVIERRLPVCRCEGGGRAAEPCVPCLCAGGAADPPGPVRGPPGGAGLGSCEVRPLPPRRKAGPAAGRGGQVIC